MILKLSKVTAIDENSPLLLFVIKNSRLSLRFEKGRGLW